jgi:hypothetical protein
MSLNPPLFTFRTGFVMRRLVSPSLSLRINSEIVPLSISRNPSSKANPISERGVPTA